MKVTLRYGELGDGTRIPCAYALETTDGRSMLIDADTDRPGLAMVLGAGHHDESPSLSDAIWRATRWLEERVGDEFEQDTYPNHWFK